MQLLNNDVIKFHNVFHWIVIPIPLKCCLKTLFNLTFLSVCMIVNRRQNTIVYHLRITNTKPYCLFVKTVGHMPLVHVFSISLQKGIVPLEWKEANIIPLFKKGSRNKFVNYRPVSLTSVICKL